MTVPDIFCDDPNTERLASYFVELYDYLAERGVPEECLPNPWHVLRRVTKVIDHELVREWLDAYSDVEAEIEEEGPETPTFPPRTQTRRSRPRPSYLRALDGARQPPAERTDDDAVSGDEGP
jgi:hypothetical protein